MPIRAAGVLLAALALAGAQEPPSPNIQRTMRLLATSTPGRRNPVRILFYGQSITKQEWSLLVAQDLRVRFPYADLTIENRAIGGYSTDYLIRTLPHDVYAFYPDLVVFHDFGGEENYERIIAGIRSHTTAEILIQTDYPTWAPAPGQPVDEAKAKGERFHDRHSFEWLPQLCRRYACGVVDVRRPWSQYLFENHLEPGAVLADGAHLNARGNALLAEITSRGLRYDSAAAATPGVHSVPAKWVNGRLRLEFTGNRIEAVAASDGPYHAAVADVWIDGKRPSAFPELYAITRPTDTFAVDWPAVNRVGAERLLLAEDWTLRVLETSPGDVRWRFSVTGSKTGPDGSGWSTSRFVSNSGRVVIEPGDWGVKRAFDLKRQLTPVGFEVRWSVVPTFEDVYRAPRIADPSRDYIAVLASGLANGKHTLELIAPDPPPLRDLESIAHNRDTVPVTLYERVVEGATQHEVFQYMHSLLPGR